jgi:hypothetical protein
LELADVDNPEELVLVVTELVSPENGISHYFVCVNMQIAQTPSSKSRTLLEETGEKFTPHWS